jgi:hypothetical protein
MSAKGGTTAMTRQVMLSWIRTNTCSKGNLNQVAIQTALRLLEQVKVPPMHRMKVIANPLLFKTLTTSRFGMSLVRVRLTATLLLRVGLREVAGCLSPVQR